MTSRGGESGISLLVPEGYASFGEVVGRHLDADLVAGKDLDVVHAHLSGDVGRDFVAVLEFDAEHRIAESLDDGAVLFDC